MHELLAPAGNLKILYAVINAGADAVYVGGPNFGARAYAKNFTEEELITAIKYCHLHNVKLFMTVNTLIKNNEFADCINMLRPFYLAGLDGVIVQDIGVITAIKSTYPNMEVHSSTQMSLSNEYGANLMKDLGVVRIVPARELSLEEIKSIKEKTGLEIECFIHGALCYSYSGQCLLSSIIGGRSGNRGRCAQPCRLPYSVLDNNGNKLSSVSNILSLKDLSTLLFLPEILEAGVYSLKIEGRMKQASYAYTVVSTYRKYLDLYEEVGPSGYKVEKEDLIKLLNAGNRDGFTDGYYHRQNGRDMITSDSSSHLSREGELSEDVLCKELKLPVNMTLNAISGEILSLTVSAKGESVTLKGDIVEAAKKEGMTEEKFIKQISKTGDSFFTPDKIEINTDGNAFVAVSVLNNLRRDALDKLTNRLSLSRDESEITALSYHERKTVSHDNNTLNHVFVRTLDQLKCLLDYSFIDRVYIDLSSINESEIKSYNEVINKASFEVYYALPFIFRKKGEIFTEKIINKLPKPAGFMARSFDSLAYLRKNNISPVLDQSLYNYSDYSDYAYNELNVIEKTLPYELNERELENKNIGKDTLVVYGRIPVMFSANCVNKNTKSCNNKSAILYLKDRKNASLPVINNCNACYNTIYNSVPTCLYNKNFKPRFNCYAYRIDFTTETKEEVHEVLNLYKDNVLDNNNSPCSFEYTWGHYKRGVE